MAICGCTEPTVIQTSQFSAWSRWLLRMGWIRTNIWHGCWRQQRIQNWQIPKWCRIFCSGMWQMNVYKCEDATLPVNLLFLPVQRRTHDELLSHAMGNGFRCCKAAGDDVLLSGSLYNRSLIVFFVTGPAGIGIINIRIYSLIYKYISVSSSLWTNRNAESMTSSIL